MIIQGNSYNIPLADNSIHCAISSFPYFGLRKYDGVEPTVWGGRADCAHVWGSEVTGSQQIRNGKGASTLTGGITEGMHYKNLSQGQFCQLCGAWLGCFGLEPSIALHVQNAVAVCREIKRVLRPDGIFWLNYGDSYATSRNGRSAADTKAAGKDDRTFRDKPFSVTELPAKNLCGIPWRVALALQDDGWILRSDVIWSKPNPMPESVSDRPTKSHEYIFMLTKEPHYFYDQDAVREPIKSESIARLARGVSDNHKNVNGAPGQPPHSMSQPRPNKSTTFKRDGSKREQPMFGQAYGTHRPDREDTEYNPAGRNRRTVWEISTQSYSAAHYATFPTKLVEPMVLASTSARGVCPECGKGWVRVTESERQLTRPIPEKPKYEGGFNDEHRTKAGLVGRPIVTKVETTGWQPACKCGNPDTIPAIVLDPFCGSGTVGQVCRELGRRFIGIDLSAEYLQQNALPRAERLTSEAALSQLPMFAQPPGGSDVAI